MKHIKLYRVFESSIESELEKNFGITYEEVGDIIQDILDSTPGLTYKIETRLLNDSLSIFNNSGKINKNGVNYFIIYIESKTLFDDTSFINMASEIDGKLSIYGLEIIYFGNLSNYSIGTNIFVSKISDKYYNCKKIPKIILT
jgi:hypothetical protein